MSANPNWEPGTFFHLHEEDPVEEYENFKLGMWIFLATEVLLFGGIFAGLFIFKYNWPEVFRLGSQALDWKLGSVNTVILLCSSYTMAMAVDGAQRGKNKQLKLNLLLTLLFAFGFLVVKYFEWSSKFSYGYFPGSDLFFSVYFMSTGLHLLHVLIGMSFIGLVYFRARQERYHEENFGGVEVCGLYWHLVDLIWIFLFPLLYLLRH
ncbi:MAG: cytochrome c oxidase subunit 3 family protein [Acidobacteriota bacterium]|nr:cytochrome c oxidase subunit 3 family protein [Acidobacteriota bacterium]